MKKIHRVQHVSTTGIGIVGDHVPSNAYIYLLF